MGAEMLEEMRRNPEAFWERMYRNKTGPTRGEPGAALRSVVRSLAPGKVLELGSGSGDDAVWLALQGWSVVAVVIAAAALDRISSNAERAGASSRLSLQKHDLTQSFPTGEFDLVLTSFLAAHPRLPVLQQAATRLGVGGHLLLIDHGSRAPWSWTAPGTTFPSPTRPLSRRPRQLTHGSPHAH